MIVVSSSVSISNAFPLTGLKIARVAKSYCHSWLAFPVYRHSWTLSLRSLMSSTKPELGLTIVNVPSAIFMARAHGCPQQL